MSKGPVSPDHRRGLAYLLIGFGVPTAMGPAILASMIFHPRRRSRGEWPSWELAPNAEGVLVFVVLAVIGVAMLVTGWALLRAARE